MPARRWHSSLAPGPHPRRELTLSRSRMRAGGRRRFPLDVRLKQMTRWIAALLLIASFPDQGLANPVSAALRARAANEIYNLDRERALASYRQAIEADPEDSGAYRGLAAALWLSITFRRGNMTVDDYLGPSGRQRTPPFPIPPDVASAFHDATERALALARKRIAVNPRDPDAHYQ